MFVELIEALRCPREHEESPLVVTASHTEARHILEGTLGCPICQAEFQIRAGEALFDADVAAEVIAPNPEAAMRLAAFLDLTDAHGYAILCGSWGGHAEEIRSISETPLMLMNPPPGVDVMATGIVRVRGRLPLAALAGRAVALDDRRGEVPVASIMAAVRPEGRVVGPLALPLPEGVRELTRDAQMWVGEKSATSEDPTRRLIALRRA